MAIYYPTMVPDSETRKRFIPLHLHFSRINHPSLCHPLLRGWRREGGGGKTNTPADNGIRFPIFPDWLGDDWLGLGGVGVAAKDASLYISTERTRWLVTGGARRTEAPSVYGIRQHFYPGQLPG